MKAESGPVAAAAPTRLLDGWICGYEGPVLIQLASRVPAAITPDHLTAFGVAGAALCAVALAAANASPLWAGVALLGLFINWLGDSLDGTLARLRHVERPRYGFFVDHLSDVGSQALIAIGLGLSPWMRGDVVLLAFSAYLVMTVYTLVKMQAVRVMQLTYFGVGPTEVRVLIALGIVGAATLDIPGVATPVGVFGALDIATIVVIGMALCALAVSMRRDARMLARLEPRSRGKPVEVKVVEIPSHKA